MKRIAKSTITTERQIERIMNERNLLEELNSDFIVKLHYAFQDDKYLYFVMDFIDGGDMFSIVKYQGKLDENIVRTYAAELILAIEYLHSRNIMYRDLKLENIMIDRQGHIKLIDLGSCCLDLGCNSVWGTIEYLSPDALTTCKTTKSNDWWALVN